MEQKYRMLEVGEWTQQGDEVLVFAHGWGKVLTWPMFVDDYCFGRLRRPVVATEDKQQLESLTKSWYDQRAELADARNEITDLTRRLEDALSEKVIAEKSYHEARAERDELLTRQQAHHREAERLSVENEELCAARYQLNTIKQAFQFIKKY